MREQLSINHPVVDRLLEENSSKNKPYPSGRELCAILDTNGIEGPLFSPEEIQSTYEVATGWEQFGGAKTVYGTSFCRADAKEIVQASAHIRFLESIGVPKEDQKILYFIDPYSHTTRELAEVMARDYGLNEQQLQEMFVQPIQSTERDPCQLPVAMQKAPTLDALQRLDLPEEVMQIFTDALTVDSSTLGNWRIAVDRISAKKTFEKLEIDPDLIDVVSFESILVNRPENTNLTVATLAEQVREAHTTHAKSIAKYSGRNGEAIENNLPSMLSIVGNQGEKLLFDADGSLHIIKNGNRFKFTDVAHKLSDKDRETYINLQESVMNMSILDALRIGGVQLSGFGYYETLGLAMEEDKTDQEKPVGMIILDDYENPDGPVTALTHTRSKNTLIGVSSIKPLVGFNGDFGAAPDLSMLTLLSPEDTAVIQNETKYTAHAMVNSDIRTFAGVNLTYDAQNKRPHIISQGVVDRVSITRLSQIVTPSEITHSNNGLHKEAPSFASIWHPQAIEKALNGNFYDIPLLKRKITGLDQMMNHLTSMGVQPSETIIHAAQNIQQELTHIINTRHQEDKSNERELALIGGKDGSIQLVLNRLQSVIEIFEEEEIVLPQELMDEYSALISNSNLAELEIVQIDSLENRIRSVATNDVKAILEQDLKQRVDSEFISDVDNLRNIKLLTLAKQSLDGIKAAFNLESVEQFILSGALQKAISILNTAEGAHIDWSEVYDIENNGIKANNGIRAFANKQSNTLYALNGYIEMAKKQFSLSEAFANSNIQTIIDTQLDRILNSMNLLVEPDDQTTDCLNPKKILKVVAEIEKQISRSKQLRQAEELGIDTSMDPSKLRDHIIGTLQSKANEILDSRCSERINDRWNRKNVEYWGEERVQQIIQEKKTQGDFSYAQIEHRVAIEQEVKERLLPEYTRLWMQMVHDVYGKAFSFS